VPYAACARCSVVPGRPVASFYAVAGRNCRGTRAIYYVLSTFDCTPVALRARWVLQRQTRAKCVHCADAFLQQLPNCHDIPGSWTFKRQVPAARLRSDFFCECRIQNSRLVSGPQIWQCREVQRGLHPNLSGPSEKVFKQDIGRELGPDLGQNGRIRRQGDRLSGTFRYPLKSPRLIRRTPLRHAGCRAKAVVCQALDRGRKWVYAVSSGGNCFSNNLMVRV
jgi:hypothetical protein